MDIEAKSRFVKLAPLKARGLAREMRGLSVAEAVRVADLTGKKAGVLIGKTLKSAIANARNNAKLDVDTLRVKEAVVEEGPTQRRGWPRARGMVSPILRRTCHIRVILTDGRADEGAGAAEDGAK